MSDLTISREEALRRATQLAENTHWLADQDGGLAIEQAQATFIAVQAWAAIAGAMQPGESVTVEEPGEDDEEADEEGR